MSQRTKLLRLIEQDLVDDLLGYERMSGLMARLYAELMARACPQIEASHRQLVELLDAAGVRAGRRAKVLGVFGLGADTQAMQHLFSTLEPVRRDRLLSAWQSLVQRVLECRQLNERNGQLLAMHSEILGQLLHQAPDQLYSPSL